MINFLSKLPLKILMKKLLPLFALFASFLYADIYLVDGVDLDDDSTYYDFDKVWEDADGEDVDQNMCWAYSVSNVLQWWQDKQSDSYISLNSIPDGNTYDDAYVSDIVSTFYEAWGNEGGFEINGFAWWLSDVGGDPLIIAGDDGSSIDFPEGGGYWSDFVSTTAYIGEQYDLVTEDAYEQYFIEVMYDAIFDDCGMTLGIYTEADGAHAITLWGYELDEDGKYWLYVTDSDDWLDEIYGMVKVEIDYDDEDGVWYLQGYDGSYDWYVGDVTTLAVGVLSVPEPTTTLLSLMALGALLARRRRV